MDKRVEDYARTLNQLKDDTNLLIQSGIKIYEIKQPKEENKVLATIEWDNDKKKYYAMYLNR